MVLSKTPRSSWTLPSSPHVCEHSDQADHSDSWQLTGHSTTQEMFICHFFSKFNCSTGRKWKGVIHGTSSYHSQHMGTNRFNLLQPERSLTSQHYNSQKSLFWQGTDLLGSIRPAVLEHPSCCESYSDTMCFCEWARWWSGPRVK